MYTCFLFLLPLCLLVPFVLLLLLSKTCLEVGKYVIDACTHQHVLAVQSLRPLPPSQSLALPGEFLCVTAHIHAIRLLNAL